MATTFTLNETNDRILAVLATAQKERHQRPGLVDGPDGAEREWAAFERARVRHAVNEIRAERGLPEVSMAEIVRVENLAYGHSDYSRKFAFYCAEIATAAA